jgi:hypothetical protein
LVAPDAVVGSPANTLGPAVKLQCRGRSCSRLNETPGWTRTRPRLQPRAVVIGGLSGVGPAKLRFDQRCQRQICILEPIPHQPRSLVERRCAVESCDKARLDTKPDRGQGRTRNNAYEKSREGDGRPCHGRCSSVRTRRSKGAHTLSGRHPEHPNGARQMAG